MQLTVSVISYHSASKQLKSQIFVIKGCQISEVTNIMRCNRVQWYVQGGIFLRLNLKEDKKLYKCRQQKALPIRPLD